MARALAKPHLRLIAVDDGAFRREQRFAPLVAVVYSLPGYVEGVLRGRVEVDGTDATERIARLLGASRHLEGARAILIDGVAVGGFNVVDLEALSERLGRPVVAVTREPPEFPKIRAAIRKYFPQDSARRWGLIRARPLFRVATAGRPILAAVVGARRRDAAELVRRTTVRGRWPEPLRLAHLIAHAIGTPAGLRRPSRPPYV